MKFQILLLLHLSILSSHLLEADTVLESHRIGRRQAHSEVNTSPSDSFSDRVSHDGQSLDQHQSSPNLASTLPTQSPSAGSGRRPPPRQATAHVSVGGTPQGRRGTAGGEASGRRGTAGREASGRQAAAPTKRTPSRSKPVTRNRTYHYPFGRERIQYVDADNETSGANNSAGFLSRHGSLLGAAKRNERPQYLLSRPGLYASLYNTSFNLTTSNQQNTSSVVSSPNQQTTSSVVSTSNVQNTLHDLELRRRHEELKRRFDTERSRLQEERRRQIDERRRQDEEKRRQYLEQQQIIQQQSNQQRSAEQQNKQQQNIQQLDNQQLSTHQEDNKQETVRQQDNQQQTVQQLDHQRRQIDERRRQDEERRRQYLEQQQTFQQQGNQQRFAQQHNNQQQTVQEQSSQQQIVQQDSNQQQANQHQIVRQQGNQQLPAQQQGNQQQTVNQQDSQQQSAQQQGNFQQPIQQHDDRQQLIRQQDNQQQVIRQQINQQQPILQQSVQQQGSKQEAFQPQGNQQNLTNQRPVHLPATNQLPGQSRQIFSFEQRDGDLDCPDTGIDLRINGIGCQQAIQQFGSYLCYTHEFTSRECCQMCQPRKQPSKTGCEFGDHADLCSSISAADCYDLRNRYSCCETCERMKRQSLPAGCEYGDMTTTCDNVRQNPGLCYIPDNKRLCCETCSRISDTSNPSCPWGDYNSNLCQLFDEGSSSIRINCYSQQRRRLCCQSCERLRRWLSAGLPSDCQYGDRPVIFTTGQFGRLNCSSLFVHFSVDECRTNEAVASNCCHTCHRLLNSRG